jgi:hypothetical protein
VKIEHVGYSMDVTRCFGRDDGGNGAVWIGLGGLGRFFVEEVSRCAGPARTKWNFKVAINIVLPIEAIISII